MRTGLFCRISLGLLFALLLVQPSFSQSTTAKIIGKVTDPSGAVISGAAVTATNVGTQVNTHTVTNDAGEYQIQALPIGSYTVAAEHVGFRKTVTEAYTLQINQEQRVNLQMQVGAASESVEVSGEVAAVDTINSTLGESVTSRPIVNLPLNGRQVLDLALLQPGVSEDNPSDTGAGTYNIGGGRADSVNFLLDGGNDNNLLSNGVVFTPNPDAVAEFRILENNYSAEYGRNAGGVVSLVTKSGTNSIHGSVFEFLRNDFLNANSFFNKREGVPKDNLKRNQFGFAVGGPVTIPKIVNGKDRFFWFVSYQGQRQTRTDTQNALNVFTPAELKGDFSGAPSGTQADVASFLLANPFFQPNAQLAAQGIIDPTKINPVAQKYIAAGLVPTSPTGSLSPQAPETDNRNELTGRFDVNATQKDRFSVTLGRNKNPTLSPFRSSATAPGFPNSTTETQDLANIGYTRTFTPNLLNEFHFTAQRNNGFQAVPARNLPKAADLGINITPDNPTGPPRIFFGDSNLVLGFSPQGPTALIDNTFALQDTVSWVKGKHTFKFGGYHSAYQNNTVFDFFVNGEFDFDGCSGGVGTGQNCQGSQNAGHDFADFLLGVPDFYLQFGQAPSNIRSKSSYGFVQDEWRVRDNLTLNLGLRYEYSTPKLDTKRRSFSLALGQQSTVFPNAPLGLLFPGDRGAPNGANFPDKNDFAPRFGFAWDPFHNGKMSVRGGFGVFYDILKGEDNLQYNGQAPFFGFAGLGFNNVGPGQVGDPGNLSNPFVAAGAPNSFPSKPPSPNIDFNASGFIPFGGGGVFFVDPHLRTPYIYQYDLSVQRELMPRTILELAYAGSDSHKLTSLVDVNPFVTPTSGRVFNLQPGLQNFGGAAFSFLNEFKNISDANYNSLQVSLTKQASETRFIGTTYFTFAYTYAKSIDNASGFRNFNSNVPSLQPGLFRSVSDYDLTNRISFSGGWDLPFDKAWQSGPSRLVKGWSLYPIVTYRTGFPLDLNAGFSQRTGRPGTSGFGDAQLTRLNLVGSSVQTFDPHQTTDPVTFGAVYFNPSNFTQPSDDPGVGGYGTLPRNFFRGPGRTNVDLALAKTTALVGEKVALELRMEAFNVFNHTQFANPDTSNINSPTFGEITTTTVGNGTTALHTERIIQFGARFTF